jgi:hypothetical protein
VLLATDGSEEASLAIQAAVEIPNKTGSYLPDFVLGRGYAFATTSYRQNGLAILEGADDIRELLALFSQVSTTGRRGSAQP